MKLKSNPVKLVRTHYEGNELVIDYNPFNKPMDYSPEVTRYSTSGRAVKLDPRPYLAPGESDYLVTIYRVDTSGELKLVDKLNWISEAERIAAMNNDILVARVSEATKEGTDFIIGTIVIDIPDHKDEEIASKYKEMYLDHLSKTVDINKTYFVGGWYSCRPNFLTTIKSFINDQYDIRDLIDRFSMGRDVIWYMEPSEDFTKEPIKESTKESKFTKLCKILFS